MKELKYLRGYGQHLIEGVETMIKKNKLHLYLLNNYPKVHKVTNDKMLYNYVMELKNEYLKKGDPISKVIYDPKISLENQALGLHTYVSRVQGKKLKSKWLERNARAHQHPAVGRAQPGVAISGRAAAQLLVGRLVVLLDAGALEGAINSTQLRERRATRRTARSSPRD